MTAMDDHRGSCRPTRWSGEPALADMLEESIVRPLLASDGMTVDDLLSLIDVTKARLNKASPRVDDLLAEALRHHQAGRLAEAEQLYRQSLATDSHQADCWHLLGVIAHQVGRNDVAVELIAKAIGLAPGAAIYHSDLGVAFYGLRRLDDAIAAYARALRIKPDLAKTHSNLGVALEGLGRLDDAIAAYRAALRIRPDDAEAHLNLGNALKGLGRLADAIAAYHAALRIKPNDAEAHYNRGVALYDFGRLDEAVASYRTALRIRPDYAEAHNNLGSALTERGNPDKAVASYRRALTLRPDNMSYAVNTHLLLPIIADSERAIACWRDRYGKGIAALATGNFADNPDTLDPHSFHLAYHNRNDRPLMLALAQMFRQRVPRLTATSPHLATWRAPIASSRRIKVGFLSEHLVGHTIGNLNQGFIRHLDRRRFEVVLIHTPKAKQDGLRQTLDALADKSLALPVGLIAQQRAIAAEELDVLFFPDVGMAQSTYFLAYARLAPVQVVTWGHPDTTGLETMDYFVSPASFEGDGAEAHYSETLIRFDRVNCCYLPPEVPARLPTRASLGLPEAGTLYGCPQSLFKFHPDFDAVLAAIAKGDPTGHIVLIEGRHRRWREQLCTRWAKTFPALPDQVLFLPNMPRQRFMALQGRMDVLLDPIHFGGGHTFYEAMVYGVPVVTWPGHFLRGRIAGGLYRQMGVPEAPVAWNLDDYAPLALALGRDPDRRRRLRQVLTEAAGWELFADMRAVREFEAFLEAAVTAAGQGAKLPTNWRHVGTATRSRPAL